MAFTNDLVDLAHELFGTNSQAMRRSATATDTYTGQAVSDSVDGMVWVIISADNMSSDAAVELPCTVVVKSNDKVIITVYGHGMVVTGVIGGGDAVIDDINDANDSMWETIDNWGVKVDGLGNKVDDLGNRLDEWDEFQDELQSFWDNDLDELRKSISNIDVQFAVSDSNTSAPKTGWRSGMFIPDPGRYVWTRTICINGLGETTFTEPVCISDGRVLARAPEEQYYLSTSNTSLVGGSWSTKYPAFVEDRYYWTKTVIYYQDGTTKESTPVCASDISASLNTTQHFWYSDKGAFVSTTRKPSHGGRPSIGATLELTGTSLNFLNGDSILASYTASEISLLNKAATFKTNEISLMSGVAKYGTDRISFYDGVGQVRSDKNYGITLYSNTSNVSMWRENTARVSCGDDGVVLWGQNRNSSLQLNINPGYLSISGTDVPGTTPPALTKFGTREIMTAWQNGYRVYSGGGTASGISWSIGSSPNVVEICYYHTGSGAYSSVRVDVSNGSKTVLLSTMNNGAGYFSWAFEKIRVYATSITRGACYYGTNASGNNFGSEDTKFRITEVRVWF